MLLTGFGFLAALGIGVYVGKQDTELIARLSGGPPPPMRLDAWAAPHEAPITRYESAVAAIDHRIFLFGGFYNSRIQASPEVFEPMIPKNKMDPKGRPPPPADSRQHGAPGRHGVARGWLRRR